MTGSVERRFLTIVGVAVIVFVLPLFVLFLGLSADKAEKELRDHVLILLAANVQALAKPLWDFDAESVEQISATVMSAGGIARLEVQDVSGDINVTKAVHDRDLATDQLRSMTRDIHYTAIEGPKKVGTITLSYQVENAFSTLRRAEHIFIIIFLVAVVVIVGAAIVGNRFTVIRPLLKLAAAIEATRRLGSRHHVDWQSNDEMGRLAQSFNGMQYQLEQEERELKLAHRRATDIYNLTPAMLFSIDDDDRLTAVSDYWLQATGYERENVIGRPFSELLAPDAIDTYIGRAKTADNHGVIETTTRFLCADGRIADMLIKEISRYVSEAGAPLSLSVMTDVTALKQSEARNHRQAMTDHLTGLMNRQGFETALDRQISETDKHGVELACLFIDLDRFKWINDNLGHQAGDYVLRRIVELMQPLLPAQAVAARLGGDEFAILLRSEQAETDAADLARRVCSIFDKPFMIDSASVRLSSSIGIALYPRHADTARDLLQKADMAMYRKKRDGKNGALLYDPHIEDSTRRHAEIERDIEAALANDWLDAFFQPIVQLNSNRTVGFEALMRICHPEKGIIPPAEIIGVAEENGAIRRLGNHMLEKAISNLVKLSDATGDSSTYLAINFSPLQFDAALPLTLASLAERYGVHPKRLVVEITEATLLHDNPLIRTILDDFSRIGCRIALDDFGTGYSSLSYLNNFPVDIVKIDQSFVTSLSAPDPERRHKSRMLVEGITAISKKMRCVVIAEGVETDEQRLLLRQFGVDNGQGYLFARPRPVQQMIDEYRQNAPVAKAAI